MSAALEVTCYRCNALPGERCHTPGGRTTDTHAIRWETRYPPPGAHSCRTFDPTCYRCDLSRAELEDQP